VVVLVQEIKNMFVLHRQELCPEKRMLFYPKLPKIIGSDFLEDRIRSIHGAQGMRDASSCHVFGHTHFCWDAVVDGIRYFSFIYLLLLFVLVCMLEMEIVLPSTLYPFLP
jgi:hypothetical protein